MEPLSGSGPTEVVSDYGSYDYRGLWKQRDMVTAVESELLRRGLLGRDLRRVVEVGTGFGRLTPLLSGLADEYVGVDFDPGHLRLAAAQARRARTGRSPPMMVLGNVYHLPFSPGSFSAEVLVRVFHHLSRPDDVLSGLAQALAEGGRLFLSYNPRPNLGTFTIDLRRALARKTGEPFVSITFGGPGPVVVPAEPFPSYVDTPAAFRAAADRAGLEIEREVGYGMEEYSRVLPTGVFVALGESIRPTWFHASRLSTMRPRRPSAPDLRPIGQIFACPRCRVGLPSLDMDTPRAVECSGCGWRSLVTAGFHDLRYVPADSVVHAQSFRATPP